ncbi:MAG: hypothetical protein RLZZ32_1236 [Cyanobacteriota bacterium]|jgi:LCP family protein required for cell wall assembly
MARQRMALRLLAAGLGVAGGLALLGLLWPEPDQSVLEDGPPTAEALAERPQRPITVLLIGSDADRQGAPSNNAAPAGPANSDALLLVQVSPEGPTQVLSLPIEAAVRLPGDAKPVALGSLYQRGGPALVASASAELVDLPKGQPDRYVVLPRAVLRELVDRLGRVELSPDRSMAYADKSQKLSIALEGGLQQLNGRQVEQLLRFRDEEGGEERRRDRQQLALGTLLRQMGQSQQIRLLPELVSDLRSQAETNLTQGESLSLLAAALINQDGIRFERLALKPALRPEIKLRELEAGPLQPRWPQPQP